MCPGDWSKCGLMLLLLLHMHLGTITGQPGNDIIVCSVVWTSHRVVLSVGRIQQRVTSFGSHRRNTGRSLWVSISSYKHRSDLVRCGSGSGETNDVEGEQNPADSETPPIKTWMTAEGYNDWNQYMDAFSDFFGGRGRGRQTRQY